jgi:hypothetical protein
VGKRSRAGQRVGSRREEVAGQRERSGWLHGTESEAGSNACRGRATSSRRRRGRGRGRRGGGSLERDELGAGQSACVMQWWFSGATRAGD